MAVNRTRNVAARSNAQHTDSRYKLVDRTLKRFHYQQDALIEVLHTAQEAFGFLTDELMIYVARELKLPQSWVYGVATFYHFFSLKPQGEHTCVVCMGTACYVKRAAEIVSVIQDEFRVSPGQTTSDGKLSLATARCLGSCGLAPVLVVDNEVLGKETPESTLNKLKEILEATPDNGELGKAVVDENQRQEDRAS
ncbi:MAG: bidirectional hydrogenase complex protein HoxE [Desulforhopalus sp.]|jgi:bidirectional [NiFe] hydrogenase diaphorase subunit|nr:bidirectional hydrogenase complex protein HoxE [Desulforhopalus sp.]